MSVFLLMYFIIYGAMNAYVLLRARAAFAMGPRGSLVLGALMLFMILAPMFVRMLEHAEQHESARALAWVAYPYFGLVFLFFSAGVALEVFRFMAIGLKALPQPTARLLFFIPLAWAVSLYAYGTWEAYDIRSEHVSISSAKVHRPVRIVQISDVHLGLMTTTAKVKRIVDAVAAASPDVLVCTGDLVDGGMPNSIELATLFKGLAKGPSYAILGNHEYYAGVDYSIAFMQSAGFTVLRSSAVPADGLPINVAGADFPSRWTTGSKPLTPDARLFDGLPADRFNLLLKHVPYVEQDGKTDLQLSGHTHKGQIFPFGLLVRAAYPRIAGLYNIGPMKLYVSRGTGTWGIPIRVLAPPEITVIDITPAKG